MNSNDNRHLEVVKKSNKLIQALGNPSLLAEKVLLLSLVNVEDRDANTVSILDKERYQRVLTATGTDFSKGLVAEITNNEMRGLTNSNSGSYYSTIQTLFSNDKTDARSLRNNLVFMAKNDAGILGYTELITGAAYDNGTMYIKFNSEEAVKREVLNLKDNYTLLDINMMMTWKSIYSYRVYELIQSRVGYEESIRKKQNKPKKTEYELKYDFGELKFLLGVLDATADSEIKKELGIGSRPNYNKIAEDMTARLKTEPKSITSAKSCAKYADFKRYALDKAEKEINECSHKDCEYTIHFEPERNGRGGKVTAVKIKVNRRKNTENIDIIDKTISDDEKYAFIDALRATSIGNLSTKELVAIATAANYSMDKISKALDVMESKTDVTNVTGFIIRAMEENWDPPTKINLKKERNPGFKQNDYDFDELEEKLLAQ